MSSLFFITISPLIAPLGLEPTRPYRQRILNPSRLPIPPQGLFNFYWKSRESNPDFLVAGQVCSRYHYSPYFFGINLRGLGFLFSHSIKANLTCFFDCSFKKSTSTISLCFLDLFHFTNSDVTIFLP